MKISIIGSGNVGLAFGTALLLKGHEVLFHDIEPKNIIMGQFTTSFSEACDFGEIIAVCVPTELGANSQIDLSIYESVCRKFAEYTLNTHQNKIFLQKSTCLPGTATKIINMFQVEYGLSETHNYRYVVFPSFLNMGHPLEDELQQKKCIIGIDSDANINIQCIMQNMLHWVKPIFNTYEAVELAKYVNNIFHASIISIWNEIYNVGSRLNVDTNWIAQVTTREKGLESIYRVHGKAWGGPCLPKDTQAFLTWAEEMNIDLPILTAVIKTNSLMDQMYGTRKEHWADLHKDR